MIHCFVCILQTQTNVWIIPVISLLTALTRKELTGAPVSLVPSETDTPVGVSSQLEAVILSCLQSGMQSVYDVRVNKAYPLSCSHPSFNPLLNPGLIPSSSSSPYWVGKTTKRVMLFPFLNLSIIVFTGVLLASHTKTVRICLYHFLFGSFCEAETEEGGNFEFWPYQG